MGPILFTIYVDAKMYVEKCMLMIVNCFSLKVSDSSNAISAVNSDLIRI